MMKLFGWPVIITACIISVLFVYTVFYTLAYTTAHYKSTVEYLLTLVFTAHWLWTFEFVVPYSDSSPLMLRLVSTFFVSLVPSFLYAWILTGLFKLIKNLFIINMRTPVR